MFCPQCFGEYREGYTTCASCKVELVESLPPEALAAIEERLQSRPAERLTSFATRCLSLLAHRARILSPGAWAVTVWLFANAMVFGVALASFFGHEAPRNLVSWDVMGIMLRGVFQAGLPLVGAVGVFLQKRWARPLCLVSFIVGFVQALTGLTLLWNLSRHNQSVMGLGLPFSTVYPWPAWLSSSLVLHATAFFAVYRYGLGRGEPVKIADVFD